MRLTSLFFQLLNQIRLFVRRHRAIGKPFRSIFARIMAAPNTQKQGSISKSDARAFLAWAREKWDMPIITVRISF